MQDLAQRSIGGRSRKTNAALLLILFLATAVVFCLNIAMGAVQSDLLDILRILVSDVNEELTDSLIILRIRLPRALATIGGGMALAISGLLLQAFFNNPIVEPYVLGISSGSSLFMALVTLGGFTFGITRITPMFIFTGAFIGAMLVMMVVIIASRHVKSMVTLLVIGMMAGYICSAGTSVMTVFAEKEKIAGYVIWSMGSFSGFTWQQAGILFAIVLPFSILAFCMSKPLNTLLMGDRYAESMGVRIRLIRRAIILISSVLTAAVTSFAGPVSFIGLAVPHMCRVIFKTADNRVLLPAAAITGALMTGLCDLIARNIIAPVELPLAAITSAIGAPIVVYLLTRGDKDR